MNYYSEILKMKNLSACSKLKDLIFSHQFLPDHASLNQPTKIQLTFTYTKIPFTTFTITGTSKILSNSLVKISTRSFNRVNSLYTLDHYLFSPNTIDQHK